MPGFGQREEYRSTASRRAVDADLAALRMDDGAADGETEPEASGLLAYFAGPKEPLEEAWLLVRGDARPLIGDRHPYKSIASFRGDEDLRRLGRVFARVPQQVREHLGGAAPVREDAVRIGVELVHQYLALGVEQRLHEGQ